MNPNAERDPRVFNLTTDSLLEACEREFDSALVQELVRRFGSVLDGAAEIQEACKEVVEAIRIRVGSIDETVEVRKNETDTAPLLMDLKEDTELLAELANDFEKDIEVFKSTAAEWEAP